MRLQHGMNSIWTWLGEDRRVAEIFLLLLVLNVLVFIIPQSPVLPGDSVAHLRWLAQTSAGWKGPLQALSAVRLTHIRTSFWMRLPLVWLTLITAAHIDRLRTNWPKGRTPEKTRTFLFSTGSLLVIFGWALQMLLGWSALSLTAWPGSVMTLAERNLEIQPCSGWICIWPEKMGLYLLPAGRAIGVEVEAVGATGETLSLVPAAKTDAQQHLQIVLTDPAAESFFLIPDVERIVRFTETVMDDVPAVVLQAYDSNSGALLAEDVAANGTRVTVPVEPVNIEVSVRSLPQFDAVYNPGAVPELSGLILLAASLAIKRKKVKPEDTQKDSLPQEAE